MRPGRTLPLLAVLAACAPAPPDRAAVVAEAVRATPSDSRLAELYQHSCRACHTVVASGAPLTHDQAAWRARWEKGLPALLSNAVQGYNGMPAGGQCVRCSSSDLEALIRFMAAEETP